MRTTPAHAVAAALVLGVAACGGALPPGDEQACSRVAAWDSGGRDAERFAPTADAAQDDLAGSDDSDLVALVDALAAAPEQDRAAAVADLLAACRDAGWVPPEG